LAAEQLSLAAVIEPDQAPNWRWWWLAVLGGSLSGWALVISLTLLLAKLF